MQESPQTLEQEVLPPEDVNNPSSLPALSDPKQAAKLGRRNSYLQGFAYVSDRTRHWFDQPLEVLENLRKEGHKWKKMQTLDCQIITRILYAFGKDGGADFERLLNRAYGPIDKALIQLFINNQSTTVNNTLNLANLDPTERAALKSSLAKMLGKGEQPTTDATTTTHPILPIPTL